jgi:hypothetical protein
MYVEISTNENMAFQRNKLFFKKSTSHGKSSNIYTLNNQPNNSYTFMIKVKKKFGWQEYSDLELVLLNDISHGRVQSK